MDENQIAEVKAAIEKARASGNIADAEQLESYLAQNTPEPTTAVLKDKIVNDESSLVPAIGGAGAAVFGGGKVAEKLASKYAPYDVNAPTSASTPSAATQRQFVSPEAVKARVEGRPLTPAPTPSVSVQGISDADLAARKTPGASASVNYGKVMAGQTLPDVVANEIQTMDKVNPKGAYQVAAKDAANLEKIKSIGEGSQKLMNLGEGVQLMLPESATKEMKAEQAAAEKTAKEKALQEAADKRSTSAKEAAKLRAERMAEVEKLKGTPGAKAAEKFAKLKSTLEVPQKYLRKAGDVMHIATSPLTTNLALRGLAGFGAGMGADEAVQRWQQGQKGRAIVSGLGAVGDIAALSRHPAAMAVGTAAGVGAPALNTYLDKWAAENPEAAEKLGLKAGGSVAGYADGGVVAPTMSADNMAAAGLTMAQPGVTNLGAAATNPSPNLNADGTAFGAGGLGALTAADLANPLAQQVNANWNPQNALANDISVPVSSTVASTPMTGTTDYKGMLPYGLTSLPAGRTMVGDTLYDPATGAMGIFALPNQQTGPTQGTMTAEQQLALGNQYPQMMATGAPNPLPLSRPQRNRFAGPQNQLRAGQPRPAPRPAAPNASFLQNLLKRGRYFR